VATFRRSFLPPFEDKSISYTLKKAEAGSPERLVPCTKLYDVMSQKTAGLIFIGRPNSDFRSHKIIVSCVCVRIRKERAVISKLCEKTNSLRIAGNPTSVRTGHALSATL